jgi:hypothetical protein
MNLSVKNRPGEHARLMLRDAQIRTIRKNALVWVCLILIAVILSEVIVVEPIPATFRAFLLGFLAASTLACFGWMVFVMSGSYGKSMGKLGEEATAEAVTSWRRRRKGWRIVNGLYLATHGDIDHVLVGPGGVFAIESKWTTNDCEIKDGAVVRIFGREPVTQARIGARKIEGMLRSPPHRLDVKVIPVVVIWGPGGLRLDRGWEDVGGGVLVCEGRREKSWLPQLGGSQLDEVTIERVTEVLASQLSRQVDQSNLANSR